MKHLSLILKLYIALALVGAAVLSPPALSFVPVILLVWFLVPLRWQVPSMVVLLTYYFLYFALVALYSGFVPFWAASLIALPVIFLVQQSLRRASSKLSLNNTTQKRLPSRLAIALAVIAISVLLFSALVGNPALILSSGIILLVEIGLSAFLLKRFPVKPLTENPEVRRILAGKEERHSVSLKVNTKLGSWLTLQSTEDWVKVAAEKISLKGASIPIDIAVTPSLSGPSVVKLSGYALDRWGIWQTRFEVEPLKLNVIPRAQYAAWLAQKYLSGTGPGTLPLLSNLNSIKASQGLRQGVEYYGNRRYLPGDNLKNIDWKHSVKYDELIVREFTEFQGRPAILLINLTAGNADEADKLAYNIVITALTLGQERIPTALAAYDHEKVVSVTSTLAASDLILNALRLTKDITILDSPLRYLDPPDVLRLRSNTRRLAQVESKPAQVLAELLRLEYRSLDANARINPCLQALSQAQSRVSEQSNVVVISLRNHDAEALAFNAYSLSQKDIAVIMI